MIRCIFIWCYAAGDLCLCLVWVCVIASPTSQHYLATLDIYIHTHTHTYYYYYYILYIIYYILYIIYICMYTDTYAHTHTYIIHRNTYIYNMAKGDIFTSIALLRRTLKKYWNLKTFLQQCWKSNSSKRNTYITTLTLCLCKRTHSKASRAHRHTAQHLHHNSYIVSVSSSAEMSSHLCGCVGVWAYTAVRRHLRAQAVYLHWKI